jgi:hypothetical protein
LRTAPLNVLQVDSSSVSLKAELGPGSHDEQGHRTRSIILEVAADLPEGRHEELVHLYTDDPAYPDLKVPVTMIKRSAGRLSATPDAVSLSRARPSQIVLIRDARDQPVRIEGLHCDLPALTARWAPGPHNMATVRIQLDFRVGESAGATAVKIRIGAPVKQTLTIPVAY